MKTKDPESGAVVAVDCRKCAHIFDVNEGYSYRCAKADTLMPWSVVASDPCAEFQPANPQSTFAAPSLSADREGDDALIPAAKVAVIALRGAGDVLASKGATDLDRCLKSATRDLERAIFSEEARRARPAVDPRDALLGRCATVLAFVAGLRSVGKYQASGDFLVDGDTYELAQSGVKALLASLRSTGVEPAPWAQEGKATT